MKDELSFEKIALKYGLLATVGLIVYFLIMKLLGLIYIVELRVFNFLILSYCVWRALTEFIKQTEDEMVYLRTLVLGVFTSLIATLPFAIFIFIYMNYDSAFMAHIIEYEMFGRYLNPYIISFLIFFEGMISGYFIAYVLMQYMKKSYLKRTY